MRVNDAPVLADTALILTVAEDAGVPSGAVGSLVSAFTGGITDVDSGASKGIAITGSNQTNGTWYYTTNGGTTWTAVGTVSNTSALLLADNGSTRLYFAPNANYNGTSTAALTVRAWDQTSGTAGTKVSTASNGGTTAFSSATDTVDVTVTASTMRRRRWPCRRTPWRRTRRPAPLWGPPRPPIPMRATRIPIN